MDCYYSYYSSNYKYYNELFESEKRYLITNIILRSSLFKLESYPKIIKYYRKHPDKLRELISSNFSGTEESEAYLYLASFIIST